jgi:hypothetical protein
MVTIPVTIFPIAATPNEVEEMIEVFKNAFRPNPLMGFCLNRPNIPRKPKEKSVAKDLVVERGVKISRDNKGKILPTAFKDKPSWTKKFPF